MKEVVKSWKLERADCRSAAAGIANVRGNMWHSGIEQLNVA